MATRNRIAKYTITCHDINLLFHIQMMFIDPQSSVLIETRDSHYKERCPMFPTIISDLHVFQNRQLIGQLAMARDVLDRRHRELTER